ncbi:hypothetical protein [Snodgrassella alvi]|nr:hypothetical protein [Snodgrassella alvi]
MFQSGLQPLFKTPTGYQPALPDSLQQYSRYIIEKYTATTVTLSLFPLI